MDKKTLKSIGAVFAGFLVVFILSSATDAILEAAGIMPPPSMGLFDTSKIILALAYRTLYTLLGGYVTARLAPGNSMKLVKILAIIGVVGGTVGVLATWGKGMGPEWYPIVLALLAYPSVWYGGLFYKKKK